MHYFLDSTMREVISGNIWHRYTTLHYFLDSTIREVISGNIWHRYTTLHYVLNSTMREVISGNIWHIVKRVISCIGCCDVILVLIGQGDVI